jgi:nucleotide-binding universal stress UspA family protein
MPLNHILIAVDGSPASAEATRVGLEIAAGRAAEVTFVHGDHRLVEALFEEDPRAKESRERRLEADPVLRDAAEAADARGVVAHVDVIGSEGSEELVPAILGMASALKADLVVVGSRRRGRLASVVLGSVSQGLLDAATIPIVVVHAPNRA